MDLVSGFRANPADVGLQAQLGVTLARAGDAAALQQMFNMVHQATRGGLACAHMIGQGLAQRDSASLQRLVSAYSQECPFRGSLLAAAGYAHALAYDLDAAVAAMREGLRWVTLAQNQIPGERLEPEQYRKLLKCAFLFEPSSWAAAVTPPPPDLQVLHAGKDEGGFACVAAADCRYFVTYGPSFLADLDADAQGDVQVVLVIVDPDAEALALAAELAARHPGATILAHAYGGAKLAEYCSGARFVVAGEMLRRLAKPVVFLDVDSRFVPGCTEVLAHMAEMPLASLHRNVMPPFLIAEASVVAAQPDQNAQAFFADVAAYFLAKMAETGPLWHVDQVALHRGIALARRRGTPPVDLGTVFTGALKLPDYFKKPHTLDFGDRAVARTDAIIDQGFSLAADGKPVF